MKIPKEFEDVFHGVELTEDEIRTLTWIVGWESRTVENLRSAIQKAQATALSTLQAENKRLNKIVCSIPTTPDGGRTVSQYDKEMSMCAYLDGLEAENEKLRAELERMRSEPGQELWSAENQRADRLEEELEKVKRERDAAQSLLAEKIGVIDAEPITTAFGLPLDRLRELAQADREGRCVVLPESYYTAEAAARKASGPAEQSERGQAAAWIMQRFGRMS